MLLSYFFYGFLTQQPSLHSLLCSFLVYVTFRLSINCCRTAFLALLLHFSSLSLTHMEYNINVCIPAYPHCAHTQKVSPVILQCKKMHPDSLLHAGFPPLIIDHIWRKTFWCRRWRWKRKKPSLRSFTAWLCVAFCLVFQSLLRLKKVFNPAASYFFFFFLGKFTETTSGICSSSCPIEMRTDNSFNNNWEKNNKYKKTQARERERERVWTEGL